MKSFKSLVASIAVVFVASSQASEAAMITTFDDRAAFDAATGGGLLLETFNSFTTDRTFHNTPVDVGDFTISMNNGVARQDVNRIDTPPFNSSINFDGTPYAGVGGSNYSLFLTFDAPITAFGADLGFLGVGENSAPRTTLNVLGDSFLPPQIGVGFRFFGLVSDTAFNVVEFRTSANDGWSFDNVAYGTGEQSTPVPTPSSIAVFIIALLGLAGFGSVKRKES